MKTRMVLFAGFLAGLSACKEADSVVLVNVSINPDVAPVYSLHVAMSTAQAHDTKIYPATASRTALLSSTSFVIVLPRSRSGVLDLALNGVDDTGTAVAHGTAQTTIVVGGTATTSVVLAAGASLCGNRVVDTGESCDDGNQFSFDGCNSRCQAEGARLDAGLLDAPRYDTGDLAGVADAIIEQVGAESAQDTGRPQDSRLDGGILDAPDAADATLDVKGPGTDLDDGGIEIGKPLLDAPQSAQADTKGEIGADAQQIDSATEVRVDTPAVIDIATDADVGSGTDTNLGLLSTGLDFACAIGTTGTLSCWGSPLNDETKPPSGTFNFVSTGEGGAGTACAVSSGGTLSCWGYNGTGVVGGPGTPPSGAFASVSVGYDYACAVRTDNTLACWGARSISPPVSTFVTVSSGYITFADYSSQPRVFACGVQTDGTITCWGDNSLGEATPPSGIFGLVSTGNGFACGVKSDGSLACWGDNSHGESPPPTGSFASVSAGDNFACGVRTNGTLACWGTGTSGQTTPPSGTFLTVGAGNNFACGMKTTGKIVCWGDSTYGKTAPP